MSEQSCLVTRLSRYIALNGDERDFLAEMERDQRPMPAGSDIVGIGSPLKDLYVLKFGWAIVRSRPVNGRSQILYVHLPGEVLGLSDIGCRTAVHSLTMQTDGTVCPFPRSALSQMYRRTPRLAALLTALSSLGQIQLRERIISLSRRSAEDSLGEFLLSLRERLAVANVGQGNRVYVPFSQAEIGDILGLTSVYVNKLMKKLVAEGQIEVERPYIRICDPDALARRIGFVPLHETVSAEWFPEAD